MLVLFETPAGYALFKVLNEGKLKKTSDVSSLLKSPEDARKVYGFFLLLFLDIFYDIKYWKKKKKKRKHFEHF